MKNNAIKCKGCKFNAINNPYCECCNGFDKFIPKQKIRYGYELEFESTTMPEIKSVIFNDPATIVLWSDGTKTVVKVKNEIFDPEKGLAMAIAKKVYGNKGNYFNRIKKWINYDGSEAENISNDLDSACKLEKSLNNVSKAIKKRRNKITSELDFFLNHAPIEADCTAKENKMFSDMVNLKNSIEDI